MKLIISSIFIFFFNLSILSAAEKIAFIDLDFVLEKSVLGKSILSEIDELNDNNKISQENLVRLKLVDFPFKPVENESYPFTFNSLDMNSD